MKAKTLFLSTALAGMLAAASAVHAVDVKVYHGSACHPGSFGTQAADISTGSNGIINLGAAVQQVTCPIVRDNHANLNGVKGVGVRVQSTGGATLACILVSLSALGDVVESNVNSTTSNVAINLPLDINTSTKGGTYELACNLPPGGAVRGYRVDEF